MIPTRIARSGDVAAVTGVPRDYLRREWFTGRSRRKLTKPLGLTQFGVNHCRLEPGACSALRHWHEREDEFVHVLCGTLTLVDENGEHELEAGDACAFPAGLPNAHHLRNDSDTPVLFLEVGTRSPGEDVVHYPDDRLGPMRRKSTRV
jgi:uncharacterized cupin superfamily protein